MNRGVKSSILSIIFWIFSNKKKEDETNDQIERENKLTCRFVLDGVGRTIGESIAVDDDILIIKSKDKYLGVPLKHIEQEGKTILVKGLVDNKNAIEMGEKWRRESFKEIKHNPSEEE